MKKNIIIVTGGAGFVGSNLIEKLLIETKCKIISLDNYSSGFKSNHIQNKRVKYILGDNKNFTQFFKKINKQIKVIFHFGEFSRIVQSFEKMNQVYDSNFLGTYEVIRFCLENKIKIIYSATSAAFGNNFYDQHLSPYSFAKTKNLDLILNFHKWYNLQYEIVYFYNVYGPRHIKNHNMAAVIGIFEYCAEKNLPLPIVKPGTQKRNFTHVSDTVSACVYAMKKNQNKQYSISCKKSYSIKEVAKLFKCQHKLLPSRSGERFKSIKMQSVHGQKITYLYGKIDLKDYVKKFIKHKIKIN